MSWMDGVITLGKISPVHFPVELTLQQSIQVARKYQGFGSFESYVFIVIYCQMQLPLFRPSLSNFTLKHKHFPHVAM